MWRDRVCGGSDSANIVSFSEFAERMDSDHQLGRWMQPVIRDLKVLRKAAIKAHKNTRGSQDKQLVVETSKENATKYIGSRLYVLQNALVDLVEFLDPAPFKTIRPDYRKRLQLGETQHAEQMRMPPALLSLYEENAKIRDRVVSRDDPYRAFRGKPIELFLKAGKNGETGDCPYSQRVQMSLCLMGLDYNTVPVDTASKPGWFHILSGESQVPVIFTNGTLIAESRHIMSFLIEKYPKKAKAGLGPATHRHGRVGTMSYTRFFPAFKAALSGRAGAVEKLQHELRVLNETLAGLQMSDRSGVFLGGKRFSREDTSIVPMLHAVDVAGIALKGKSYGIPDDCGAVKTYLAAAREQPCFIATAPSREATIEGYGHLVDREKEFVTTRPWLQDLLE
jgi:glutathione dehydrogenase/transferase